jgi:hypothetical protein
MGATRRVAEVLFRDGLCLPSGSNTFDKLSTSLSEADLVRVAGVIRSRQG